MELPLNERIVIIKTYMCTNIDVSKYIGFIKECREDDLLIGKLYLLNIYPLEFIFVIMFYNHNFMTCIEGGNDFYYKLKYSVNFLNYKINNFNIETTEIETKLLIIFIDILQRYEQIQNNVNNDIYIVENNVNNDIYIVENNQYI